MEYNDVELLDNIKGQSQLLAAALSASISGIIITDWLNHDNPIIYCNKAFEEMTGYIREEIVGKNCRFLQGEDREQIGRYKLKEAMEAEKDCHVEMINYRKDNSIFYNELYIAPIKDENGTTTHYVGIQNDITIRKQKEISLQLALSNTIRLQQQKDEFTNLASHELRTPVTSLRATLQLVNRIIKEDQIANQRIIALTKSAERNIKKLSNLVDDLLMTTLIEQEELVLNKTTFTFSELIEGCCNHVLLSGTHKVTNSGNLLTPMHADQHKIDQVMINLIDNAVKYAPQCDEIMVDIEQNNNSIKVSVTDKGSGIAAEELSDIFLRYKKAKDNLANQSGLGLGLYICSEIIRKHDGDIGVESTPGSGSKFWFTLPESNE